MTATVGGVLVGIDGSPCSAAALRWAAWLATATGRELHVAHAWQHGALEPPAGARPPVDGVDGREADVEVRLAHFVRGELGDATAVTSLTALRGTVTHALGSEASRRGATVVVVGARGAGGALRRLLGSVSRDLTEGPTRTVAVVPDREAADRPQGPARIVVGIDGSDASSRALRWAIDTARRAGAEVIAVHAFEPPLTDLTATELAAATAEAQRRFEEEWCAPLHAAGVPARTVFERGSPSVVVASVADATGPACVVVGTRGRGALTRRVLGSVSNGLVRELTWPIVIVPTPHECPDFRL